LISLFTILTMFTKAIHTAPAQTNAMKGAMRFARLAKIASHKSGKYGILAPIATALLAGAAGTVLGTGISEIHNRRVGTHDPTKESVFSTKTVLDLATAAI
jgi:hypothetical protein